MDHGFSWFRWMSVESGTGWLQSESGAVIFRTRQTFLRTGDGIFWTLADLLKAGNSFTMFSSIFNDSIRVLG